MSDEDSMEETTQEMAEDSGPRFSGGKGKVRVKRTYPFETMKGFKVTGADASVVYMGYDKAEKKKGVRFNRARLTVALAARGILDKHGTMTLRGLYYALFGAGWIENSQEVYKGLVIPAMVEARQMGIVEWNQIDDTTRIPSEVQMWDDLADFMETVKKAYRRNIWNDQPVYIEAWLEKRTGVSQAKEVCHPYGVAVNAGNGYDGWSSIYEAAVRYNRYQEQGKRVHVLYIGDFDPSGLQMFESFQERMQFFVNDGTLKRLPSFVRLGVNDDDIQEYDLPEAPGKVTDSRSDWMVRNYGKLVQVEMDALWALDDNVFQAKLKEAIEERLDMDAFEATVKRQTRERKALEKAVESVMSSGDIDDDNDSEE